MNHNCGVGAEAIVGLDLAQVIDGLSAERQRLRLIVRFEPDDRIREASRVALRRVEGVIEDVAKALEILRGCRAAGIESPNVPPKAC